MALNPGHKLGPYEIAVPIGAGGMGEVYRARDPRLERTVAVKVLPSHLSSNADLKQRFEREAKAISSLQHPHICTLFDVGSQDGVDFLVMEYLEGETLAQRLVKGPLKIDEALKIALEVTGALDKAHRQGIIHRDLKPGNVMLTKSGAKLMDFGLAKPALAIGATASHVTPNTPTMSVQSLAAPASPLTQKGTIVGTFQYMAPEVLQGAEADARSDIFSFGCVLYEMITGRRAFEGKSQISVLAAILEKDPEPISTAQRIVPQALEHAISTCLAKDPEQRWQSVADVGHELRWAAQDSAVVPAAVTAKSRHERWWIAACAVLLIVAAAGAWRMTHLPKPAKLSLQIAPPEKSSFGYGLALSPDGSQFCFAFTSFQGQSQLACRGLNSVQIKVLSGTEGAEFPFWSPDGSTVAFFAGGKLKKVDLASGSVQSLADASDSRGGDWGSYGDIIYTPTAADRLYRVSASGGRPTPITRLDREVSHRWPHFLPDGKHFLYFSRSAQGMPEEKIYIGTLGSEERRELMTASAGVTAIPGYVLFLRARTLFVQHFDENKLQLKGEPIAIVDGVEPEGESGPTAYSPFTVSQNGVLIYLPSISARNQLAWFDRDGKRLQVVGSLSHYDQPSLSPDGTRLAVDFYDENGSGVWLLDLTRGTFTRFSLSVKSGNGGVWSPDGKTIVFSGTGPQGGFAIFQKQSNGAGPEDLLPGTGGFPDCFSPDGRILMFENFRTGESNNVANLWVLPLTGERKPREYLPMANFNRTHAAFSPDGRWVAYTSDESGRPEIYVQSFPEPTTKLLVSDNGGDQAQWRADGKELFYLGLNRAIVSVKVETGGDFVAQKPETLFTPSIRASTGANDSRANYGVSRDGKRFLVNAIEQNVSSQPVVVTVNWTSELKK